MNLINWINGVTKLSKATMDAFQDNIKDAVDGLQDDIDSMNEITTGTGTISTTYVDTAEYNHWERVGQVVSYSFTITTKGTWNNTTIFITGLPKPKAMIRFTATNHSYAQPFRCAISTNGELSNAYSTTVPASGKQIEGHVTYITSE